MIDIARNRGRYRLVPPAFTWQALAGQGWPATARQEREFVAALRRAAAGPGVPSRPDTTVVLNALRCGVTFDQLLDVLPSVDPDNLLASYTLLDDRIAECTRHWRELVADPTPFGASAHAATAALLVPVPVQRIRSCLHPEPASRTARTVAIVTAEISRVTDKAHAISDRLDPLPPGTNAGVRLGQTLHDVTAPGVWAHPYFMPSRVGELSTIRARDLRGDDRV